MRVEFHQPAEAHERYAPNAFDNLIGTDAPLRFRGAELGQATVVSVTVDEDGRGVTWEVEIHTAS